jgi:hypothetical protein
MRLVPFFFPESNPIWVNREQVTHVLEGDEATTLIYVTGNQTYIRVFGKVTDVVTALRSAA